MSYEKVSKEVLVAVLHEIEAVYGKKSVEVLVERVGRQFLKKRLDAVNRDSARLAGTRRELMASAEAEKDPSLRYEILTRLRKVMDKEHRQVELHARLYKEMMGG